MVARTTVLALLTICLVLIAGCVSPGDGDSREHDLEVRTIPTVDAEYPDPAVQYGHNQPDASVQTPRPLANKTPRSDVNVSLIEDLLAEKLNEYRQIDDAQPLVTDPRLAIIARHHSYDMAARDFFNHTNPDGETYSDRLRNSEYLCSGGGENLQATYWKIDGQRTEENMAESLLRGFMGSAPHNTAMIRPDYTTVGIGIYIAEDRRTYVTMALCDGDVLSEGAE